VQAKRREIRKGIRKASVTRSEVAKAVKAVVDARNAALLHGREKGVVPLTTAKSLASSAKSRGVSWKS
jgi:hypothetical protein